MKNSKLLSDKKSRTEGKTKILMEGFMNSLQLHSIRTYQQLYLQNRKLHWSPLNKMQKRCHGGKYTKFLNKFMDMLNNSPACPTSVIKVGYKTFLPNRPSFCPYTGQRHLHDIQICSPCILLASIFFQAAEDPTFCGRTTSLCFSSISLFFILSH